MNNPVSENGEVRAQSARRRLGLNLHKQGKSRDSRLDTDPVILSHIISPPVNPFQPKEGCANRDDFQIPAALDQIDDGSHVLGPGSRNHAAAKSK